ncbi:hypothetical protein RclHR1_15110002 [Rhizophagus clarus]|nr:hypothetical protein RclHR1_15110002 [Rhizophagus clarus]
MNAEKFNVSIAVGNEILNLFNKDTKSVFLNLIDSQKFNTFHISGSEHCFSELETLHCNDSTSCNTLKRLAITNTSIKKLKFEFDNNDIKKFEFVKLIEVQKNLKDVNLICNCMHIYNESCYKPLEEALIKCANIVQYLEISNWRPFTRFLSYLVNLVSLEIKASHNTNWNYLGAVSLPYLKFLKVVFFPSKFVASLIKRKKAYLIEINILYQGIDYGKVIVLYDSHNDFKWDMFFKILAKLFLNNWKDRYLMLLQIISKEHLRNDYCQQQKLRRGKWYNRKIERHHLITNSKPPYYTNR